MARIVMVEDDRDVARLLATLLVDAGHEVHAAVDGQEGIALIQQVRPDLALVDMTLPGAMDGLDVTRSIRATDGLEQLTARSRPEDRQRGEEAGVSDYLVKPDGIVDLLPRIEAVLR